MWRWMQNMNSMKLVIPLHFYLIKKDSKRCCDTTTPESIHTKDESKHGFAFVFFGVNWQYNECNGMTSFMEFMVCALLRPCRPYTNELLARCSTISHISFVNSAYCQLSLLHMGWVRHWLILQSTILTKNNGTVKHWCIHVFGFTLSVLSFKISSLWPLWVPLTSIENVCQSKCHPCMNNIITMPAK